MKYYQSNGGIEPIDLINAFNLNFNCGNVIKYVVRAGNKIYDNMNKDSCAVQDLEKAKKYIEFEIERVKHNADTSIPHIHGT